MNLIKQRLIKKFANETLVDGLTSIKENVEYELKFSDDEIWQGDVKTIEKAISIVKDPDQLKDMTKEDVDELLSHVNDLLRHSENQARTNDDYKNDISVLQNFEDFVKNHI